MLCRLALAIVLALPLLLACPDPAGVDAGPAAADAGGGSDADAGTLDGGREDDGGPPPDDAGPDDDDDAGAPDGGELEGDAGPACAFPDLEPPPDLDEDAGPPSCDLEDTRGTGDYVGTWEGQVYGSFPLSGAFDLPASGEMSFTIYCGDDKLLVDGELVGRAYQHPDAGPEQPGHPFSGRMFGELNPITGTLSLLVDPATLEVATVFGILNGSFRVALTALRQEDNTFEDGGWCGVTTTPEGGAGEGSWRAEPATVDVED